MKETHKRQIPSIELWILGTMRDNDEIVRRFMLTAQEVAASEAASRDARAAGLHQPDRATRSVVRALFGPPQREIGDSMLYELKLWPEHIFVWEVDKQRRIVNSTFQRRHPRVTEVTEEKHPVEFEVWNDTESEVRTKLGRPDHEGGWWPEYELQYYSATDGVTHTFTFKHGLLIRAVSFRT